MGGAHATGELPAGADTQVWLVTSDEPAAAVTGRYLKSRREQRANPAAYDTGLQDALLAACAASPASGCPASRSPAGGSYSAFAHPGRTRPAS